MIPMPSIWNKIESRDRNTSVQRQVLVLSIVFLLLFVGLSTVTGEAIGAMGKETGQLLADSAERRGLGKDIAQVRGSMQGSIPSQIATYKEIGPARRCKCAGVFGRKPLVVNRQFNFEPAQHRIESFRRDA
jgi:hypothetical protein